jgi:hypothetical protein
MRGECPLHNLEIGLRSGEEEEKKEKWKKTKENH